MKQTLLVFAALLMFIVGTASAGDLDLDVKCPGSVKAGTALTVTADMYNNSVCPSVGASRFMMSLIGNKGGTLGGAGLWGPFYKGLTTAVSVPCTGVPKTQSLTIINAVPADLGGTGAMVMVQVIDGKGREMGTGSCIVNVLN